MTSMQQSVHPGDLKAADAVPPAPRTIEAFVDAELRKARKEVWRNRLLAFGFGIFVLLAWMVATEAGFVHRLIIPTPKDTWLATVRVMSADFFWPNVWVTLQEIFWGFALGMGAGAILGIGVAMFASVRVGLVSSQSSRAFVTAPIFAKAALSTQSFGSTSASSHRRVGSRFKHMSLS